MVLMLRSNRAARSLRRASNASLRRSSNDGDIVRELGADLVQQPAQLATQDPPSMPSRAWAGLREGSPAARP